MIVLTQWAKIDTLTIGGLNNRGSVTGARDALLGERADGLWSRRVDELRAMRLLEDDWDGQAAKAPSAELVDSAVALALRRAGAELPSRIVPGVNGTVIFEWQAGEEYCEIEVTRPFHAECLRFLPGQPAQHYC